MKKIIVYIFTITIILITFSTYIKAESTSYVDQSNIQKNMTRNYTQVGQSFTLSQRAIIDKIDVKIKSGSGVYPADIHIEIWSTDSNGLPLTKITSSEIKSIAPSNSIDSWTTFDFINQKPILSENTKYAFIIVAKQTQVVVRFEYAAYASQTLTTPYKNGNLIKDIDFYPENGILWTNDAYVDLTFQIWISPPQIYTIGFISDGEKIYDDILVEHGSKISSPGSPVKAGYTFEGWYREISDMNQWNFENDSVFSTITLKAKWKPISYTIKYNLNGGTNSISNPVNYTYETNTISFGNPYREGYIFLGWYDNTNFFNNPISIIEKGSIGHKEYYAKWVKDFNGIHNIVSKNSNLVMDVFGGGNDQGVNVIQWPYHGMNNQQWKLESLNNGYYKIVSVKSGLSLDVFNGGTDVGNRVIQWSYHGGINQQWKIIENIDGTISFMSRLAEESGTNYLLDVFNGGNDKGVNVIQWTGHFGDNQKWSLNTVPEYTINYETNGGSKIESSNKLVKSLLTEPTPPTKSDMVFAGWYQDIDLIKKWNFTKDLMPNSNLMLYAKWEQDYSGIYNIKSKNSDLVMDIFNGGSDQGVNVIQWPLHGKSNQQWKFEALDNGYYKISSMLSGMSIDVFNGGIEIGNRVIQWPYHGGTNQQWKIITNDDGTVSLMSRLAEESGTNFILDVYGGGKDMGVNVIQWNYHYGDNQKWYMDPIK